MDNKVKKDPTYFESNTLKGLDNIVHGFFTRTGGVSKSPYASLNTSFKKNDKKSNVEKNRKAILNTIKTNEKQKIATLEQTHSTICHTIEKALKEPLKGDALVTNKPNILLGILTADCVPVLLVDSTHGIIGAAHAGWKGTINGILANTIESMIKLGAKRNQIKAAIGPCIHQDSYEIGIEVYNELMKKKDVDPHLFLQVQSKDKWLFDLPGFVTALLLQEEIAEISNLDLDTYKNEALFFSCRRAYHNKEKDFGIQMSLIGLTG